MGREQYIMNKTPAAKKVQAAVAPSRGVRVYVVVCTLTTIAFAALFAWAYVTAPTESDEVTFNFFAPAHCSNMTAVVKSPVVKWAEYPAAPSAMEVASMPTTVVGRNAFVLHDDANASMTHHANASMTHHANASMTYYTATIASVSGGTIKFHHADGEPFEGDCSVFIDSGP